MEEAYAYFVISPPFNHEEILFFAIMFVNIFILCFFKILNMLFAFSDIFV